MKQLLALFCGGFVALVLTLVAAPLDSSIHYQGSLSENGEPATGTYDLRLTLNDAEDGGELVGPTLTNLNVTVTEGLIRTTLDFGADVFDGSALWLEVGVRLSGSEAPFVTLSPRQALSAVPYAVHALKAETVPDGSVSGEKVATGQVVRSINGLTDHVSVTAGSNIVVSQTGNALTVSATVTEGPPGPEGPEGPPGSADAWSLTGNAGTDPAVNFVGTLDDQPLELRIGGSRVLRFERSTLSDGLINIIGGHQANSIEPDSGGSVIAGGVTNFIRGSYATVSGGVANAAEGDYSVVAGGIMNYASGEGAGISAGSYNYIEGQEYAVIGGGENNSIEKDSERATISGGGGNAIYDSTGSSIGGGARNFSLDSPGATISGGFGNYLKFAGGSTIGGGRNNSMGHDSLVIDSVIAGGENNQITSEFGDIRGSAIGGGSLNHIVANHAVIAGGHGNTIGAYVFESSAGGYQVIAGGASNKLYSSYSNIGGGADNLIEATADYGTILGGSSNVLRGAYALAAGRRAMALHDGAFIWGDSTDDVVESSATNEFTVRASGGARFFSSADLSTGVTLAAGDGSWASVSDRNAKRDFEPIDGVAVLEKVAALPLSTWSYKSQDSSVRHIGPIAQDFHAAFGVGADDTRITSVDADGVALAAIQGLNQKLISREAEIADLRQQNSSLEKRLANLEAVVELLSSQGLTEQ